MVANDKAERRIVHSGPVPETSNITTLHLRSVNPATKLCSLQVEALKGMSEALAERSERVSTCQDHNVSLRAFLLETVQEVRAS